jgi:hypothetical protein
VDAGVDAVHGAQGPDQLRDVDARAAVDIGWVLTRHDIDAHGPNLLLWVRGGRPLFPPHTRFVP